MNQKHKEILVAAVAVVSMLPGVLSVEQARAQSGLRNVPIPTSFCAFGMTTTAVALTVACSAGIAATASYLVVCAYTTGVNYRDDGVPPTATIGVGGQNIPSGQCIGYNGTPSSLQFFGNATGATVGISFYK